MKTAGAVDQVDEAVLVVADVHGGKWFFASEHEPIIINKTFQAARTSSRTTSPVALASATAAVLS